MAKAFSQRFERLRRETRNVAIVGCKVVEGLRRAGFDQLPTLLNDAQFYLRACLIEAEADIRDWGERKKRRRARFKRLRKRSAHAGSAVMGEHLRVATTYGQLLAERRQMLRQIGDALAWTVLRNDPRVIYPLFAPRSHHLSLGEGLTGVVEVIGSAHAEKTLLALDNDLTRCLGCGDITIVGNGIPWRMPLYIECKTLSVEEGLVEGSEITVNMSAPVYSDPLHQALHAEFSRVIGANIGVVGHRPGDRYERQESEMTGQAEFVFKVLSRQPFALEPQESHWRSVGGVVARALQSGSAYDIPEKGLAIVATRSRTDDNAKRELQFILERLQADGFPKGYPCLTLGDLNEDDRMAALVPPIASWPIPIPSRVALLSGDCFLGVVTSPALWEEAFEAGGTNFSIDNGFWIIAAGDKTSRFDPIEVLKLRLGVGFGGISPRSIAKAVVAEMSAEPAFA